MKRLGLECVYLDITHKSSEQIKEHFPTVQARCAELGIDITRERIPVVPAAHYTCGGVVVDQYGASDVRGLYVIGETACTGPNGEQFITRVFCLRLQCRASHEHQLARQNRSQITHLG
jgi:L-aspartate oxidase